MSLKEFVFWYNVAILKFLISEMEIIMDRLDAMSLFLAVIDTGSFAGAARKLASSPASVTRAVAQLEMASGQQLLERSTRHLAVTKAGMRHATIYRQMLEGLAEVEHGSDHAGISGTLVITAPELFGRLHVLSLVQSFLKAHPSTQIRLLLRNRVVDLVGEGVDIAVRLAHLPDSALTAIKVGTTRKLFCASPAYLEMHGVPRRPNDLVNHVCIGLSDQRQEEQWQYRGGGASRRTRSVRVQCNIVVNSAAAAIDVALTDMGVIQPMSYQVDRHIADGSLVQILEEFELEPVPIHLVFQSRKGAAKVVRAFIDHAVPMLRKTIRDL